MNFMMHEYGSRSRRQRSQRSKRVIVSLLFVFGLCALSYWWGGERVRTGEVAYKEQATKLQAEREGLDAQITKLNSDVQSTNVRYDQLMDKYKAEVPQGDFKTLADLVKKQLDAGIKPERLSFVIDSARPPKNCTEPAVKRFVVKTPVYNGPQGAVAFGNGVVTVAGDGAPSVDPAGKQEAWYDPGKPVKITFTEIGGKQTVKEGLLPLQHSLVVGNKEYRFTVAAGERSFLSVTSDTCDYP